VAVLTLPQAVLACSVCFGNSDSDMSKGLNAGVAALLAVVAMVLAGFAAFFVFVARRSALAPKPQSESTSQDSSTTD
jgi:hypothetical protein